MQQSQAKLVFRADVCALPSLIPSRRRGCAQHRTTVYALLKCNKCALPLCAHRAGAVRDSGVVYTLHGSFLGRTSADGCNELLSSDSRPWLTDTKGGNLFSS